jgi:hypothetical protein
VIENGVLIKYNGPAGDVVIPDGVTIIGERAFPNRFDLMNNPWTVTIPEGVTDILDEAFFGCGGLTSVTFPNSLKNIGNSAFSGCFYFDTVSIILPEGLTNIGANAFGGCGGLISITIPESVVHIGEDAFSTSGFVHGNGVEFILKWIDPIQNLFAIYFEPASVKVPKGTKDKYIAAGWGTSEQITEYQLSSITTVKRLEEIAVYPNPVVDYAVVSGAQGCKLTVVDTQGHVVCGKISEKNEETINTSDWAKGVYFFIIQSDDARIVKSIIKK